MKQPPDKKAQEKLVTCPGCGTPNFTPRGLKAHKCKGVPRETGKLTSAIGARMSKPLARKTALKRNPATRTPIGQTLRIPLNQLRPHPLLGRLGLLPDLITREQEKGKKASGHNRQDHQERAGELNGEFEALAASIALNGVREPIKVVREAGGWAIADGRHRWEVAKHVALMSYGDPKKEANARKLQSLGIPAVEVTAEEVPAIIMDAANRRHMSKQARALLAVIVHPEAADEAKAGRPKESRNDCGISQEDLAKRAGVSLRTMESACAFWREIQLRKSTKDERINQVFAGISFDNVLKGAGGEKQKGYERPPVKVWTLLMRNANSTKTLWNDYAELKEVDKREQIITAMADAMKAAPSEIREAIQAAWEGGEDVGR